MKRNFPGGNDGGLQAHPLKILTDGRMMTLGGPGPEATAPIIASKPDLCFKLMCDICWTYCRCIARISFCFISDFTSCIFLIYAET